VRAEIGCFFNKRLTRPTGNWSPAREEPDCALFLRLTPVRPTLALVAVAGEATIFFEFEFDEINLNREQKNEAIVQCVCV
jgi:hypothetical protein